MNKDQMRSVLKNLTEDKAPASQINLLSTVQSRIQMSQSIQSKGIIMKEQTNSKPRRLRPAFILAAIVLIAAIFFSLPEGRTLAQQVIHFFTRGETNVMPGPTATPVKWVEQTPGVAAPTFTSQPTITGPVLESSCGTYQEPHCSIDEIRKMVNFPVFALAELPGDLYFSGATGGQDEVYISYKTHSQTGLLDITEQLLTDDLVTSTVELGADAEIQSVQVGSVLGEYVKGAYDGNHNPPVWNPDADVQVLRWVNQGVVFTMTKLGIEPLMTWDDMAALAVKLTNDSVGESGIPVIETESPADEAFDLYSFYPLTLAEAEGLAGFKLLTPEKLPETMSFVGAKYDEKLKVVIFLYNYSAPDGNSTMDSLVLSEQIAGSDCNLCRFVRGKFEYDLVEEVVSEDAKIETVQIGNLTGQYLEGIGWVNKTNDISGWAWESTDYRKRLRFQSNGLGIEVWADGFEWTKADLISIAESLK